MTSQFNFVNALKALWICKVNHPCQIGSFLDPNIKLFTLKLLFTAQKEGNVS